jgi:hypothetical protein
MAVVLFGKTYGGVPCALFVLGLVKPEGRIPGGQGFPKSDDYAVTEDSKNPMDEFDFLSVNFNVLVIQKPEGGLTHSQSYCFSHIYRLPKKIYRLN